MSDPQTTLRRDVLEEAFASAETPEPVVTETVAETVQEPEVQTEGKPRDEAGRFAPKAEEPVVTEHVEQEPQLVRPTTWKKEYLPLWDKMASGQTLTPDEAKKLAQYSNQRETEYKTGVSTYKTEAERAKELQDAIAPFVPELQRYNLKPSEWIGRLGNAHRTLAMGNPQEKLQMFATLAKDYGVPLEMLQNPQAGSDPAYSSLMQQIQNLQGQVRSVDSWREQQEISRAEQAIAEFKDAEKYPYFEEVRGTMGQLLASGLATDLKTAYSKAVRMNDEVYQRDTERQSQANQAAQAAQRAAAAQRAKANVTSVRSATPSGSTTSATAKDRRSLLASALDSAESRV